MREMIPNFTEKTSKHTDSIVDGRVHGPWRRKNLVGSQLVDLLLVEIDEEHLIGLAGIGGPAGHNHTVRGDVHVPGWACEGSTRVREKRDKERM